MAREIDTGWISTETFVSNEPRVLKARIGANNAILGYDDVTEHLVATSEGFTADSGGPG